MTFSTKAFLVAAVVTSLYISTHIYNACICSKCSELLLPYSWSFPATCRRQTSCLNDQGQRSAGTDNFSLTVLRLPLFISPAGSTRIFLALLNTLKHPSNHQCISQCHLSLTSSWKTSLQTARITAVRTLATMRRLLIDVTFKWPNSTPYTGLRDCQLAPIFHLFQFEKLIVFTFFFWKKTYRPTLNEEFGQILQQWRQTGL